VGSNATTLPMEITFSTTVNVQTVSNQDFYIYCSLLQKIFLIIRSSIPTTHNSTTTKV
jgi:hypothetical protein